MSQERIVSRCGFQDSLLYVPQQEHRIVTATLPQVAIEPAKQFDRCVIPAPAQVVGNVEQRMPAPAAKDGL
jgi:hypothetical protein